MKEWYIHTARFKHDKDSEVLLHIADNEEAVKRKAERNKHLVANAFYGPFDDKTRTRFIEEYYEFHKDVYVWLSSYCHIHHWYVCPDECETKKITHKLIDAGIAKTKGRYC